jgi:hypothetical protein
MKTRPSDIRLRIEARRLNRITYYPEPHLRAHYQLWKDRDFYLDDCN